MRSRVDIRTTLVSVLVVLCSGSAACPDSSRPAPDQPDPLARSYQSAADFILRTTGLPAAGYCLVFGAGEGRLALALAERSRYVLLGVEEDPSRVARGRQRLRRAGVYGSRVTLHGGSLSRLRYRDYAAAIVVSDSIVADGVCSGSAAEMFRMVRPDGGMALVGQPPGCPKPLARPALEAWLEKSGLPFTIVENTTDGLWAVIRRGPLPGAGEWTHVRGDIANTSCSGEKRTSDAYRLLWFGTPGPRVMVDRHWKAMPPLYKNGRMITVGFDRIICSDAYNGAQLWQLDAPGAARIAMLRDAGWLALADDSLYVAAGDHGLRVDVRNGEAAEIAGPRAGREWGYIAVDGDRLYGSEQIPEASYLASTTGGGWKGNRLARGDDRYVITSAALFCQDRRTNRRIWTYSRDDAVIENPRIAIGEKGLYFFESTSPDAAGSTTGRVRLADFTAGASEHVVRLDKYDGKVVWRRQHDMPAAHVLHLACARSVVLASGTTTSAETSYRYHLRAFSAETGSPLWRRELDRKAVRRKGGRDATHGLQDKPPLVVGQTVYYREGAFDLRTGEPRGFDFSSTGCANYAASETHIFGRGPGGAVSFWDLEQGGEGAPICSVMRTGCYISVIPAGGIVMLPPAAAGCMCDYTLEASIAWSPSRRPETTPGREEARE